MQSVTTVGRHYVSDYFYCCIQRKGLLYDAKRYLLAIAKFLVFLFIPNDVFPMQQTASQ